MSSSQEIVLFSDNEEEVISVVSSRLSGLKRREDVNIVRNNRMALEELARSISLYPSILSDNRLAGTHRSMESLIEKLCTSWVPDMVLHIPTKAILGRGYTIAKINFFIMLRYIVQEIDGLKQMEVDLLSIISTNVFTLTAEEVFITIIEDMRLPREVRYRAAGFIAQIWEHRIDYGVREFAPILQQLWKSREKLVPNFGTMMGFSELCMLSMETENRWLDFLQRDDLSDDEVLSLEEFIFGLTWEEIQNLRKNMEENGRSSLSRTEVESLLDKPHLYPGYWTDDPRELYRSFRDRKHNSSFRARAGVPGPRKTLEEYLMVFLLAGIPEDYIFK